MEKVDTVYVSEEHVAVTCISKNTFPNKSPSFLTIALKSFDPNPGLDSPIKKFVSLLLRSLYVFYKQF